MQYQDFKKKNSSEPLMLVKKELKRGGHLPLLKFRMLEECGIAEHCFTTREGGTSNLNIFPDSCSYLVSYDSFFIYINAPRLPRFPWLARCEKSRCGLQQVQTFVTARCSGQTPASKSTISFAFQRSS